MQSEENRGSFLDSLVRCSFGRQIAVVVSLTFLSACNPAQPAASGSVSGVVGSAGSSAKAPEGKWSISEVTSEMDGRKEVIATIESENLLTNSIGAAGKAGLVVRCVENKTDVLFSWPSFVGTFEGVRAEIKIGDGPIIDRTFSPSADGGAFGFWGARQSVPFLKQMQGQSRVIVRASGWNRTAEEAVFHVSGISEAIEKVSAACKWGV